jgi:hypothetical protein
MAITEPYAGTLTVSTTELSLVSGTATLQSVTDDGVYQLFLDLTNIANGDSFEVRVKEKVTSAGTQRVAFMFSLTDSYGADGAGWVSPSLILLHGWDVTLIKTAGTDRSFGYSIRKVA